MRRASGLAKPQEGLKTAGLLALDEIASQRRCDL